MSEEGVLDGFISHKSKVYVLDYILVNNTALIFLQSAGNQLAPFLTIHHYIGVVWADCNSTVLPCSEDADVLDGCAGVCEEAAMIFNSNVGTGIKNVPRFVPNS